MNRINIVQSQTIAKFLQVTNSIIMEIEKGNFKKDDCLPSITTFSSQYNLSRDTIEKAYKELIKRGYTIAIKGKGNYVLDHPNNFLKVLLVFNKFSSYKKIVYESFLKTLGKNVRVDLKIHNYDPKELEKIIDENLGKYHYYVIMPHFFLDAIKDNNLNPLRKIPDNQLLLLDKKDGKNYAGMGVYQDFKYDIYKVLKSERLLMDKYERIEIVFSERNKHPIELIEGVLEFCVECNKQFAVISSTDKKFIRKKTAYIVVTESDLAILIKQCRELEYSLGKDVGILSFNETIFKELLDISVVTTDFEEMGRSAARLILEKKNEQIENPFYFIQRNSL